MKVVGKSGDDWLLIIPGNDLEAALAEELPIARVLRRRQKWLSRPASLYSLLKQGDWEKAELPDAELRALLSDLKRVDGPGVDEPWVLTRWEPAEEFRKMPRLKRVQ